MIPSHEDRLRAGRFREAWIQLTLKKGIKRTDRKLKATVETIQELNLKPENFIQVIWTAVNVHRTRKKSKKFDMVIMAAAYHVIRITPALNEAYPAEESYWGMKNG